MKIKSLQISNVLSFRHRENISNAEKLTFDDGLNIIIGENGSGKSTALEVINFLFKRVIYRQYDINQDLYSRRNVLNPGDRKQILNMANNSSHREFRLQPNWDTPEKPQTIRIELQLDEIDKNNLRHLRSHSTELHQAVSLYTRRASAFPATDRDTYMIDVTLDQVSGTFGIILQGGIQDFGFEYLVDYNFYKESIALHNLEHPDAPIDPLAESFTLISSYRNYHAFDPSVTLSQQTPSQQMQQIKSQDFAKSLNTGDQSEPSIFRLVRLRVAEKHFGLFSQKLSAAECEAEANRLPFMADINKRLTVVNLECRIALLDQRTWQYSFVFVDTRNKKTIADVNSLSAGQKAIVHLVFEAYGRGDIKGGLVIIDEPEIHLHYQFQNEYLQVIKELNKGQLCQYILVTHSEALINSSTISQVRRFSLNRDGHTEFHAPTLTTDQRMLIKILDNTRSTYAFFAKKALLVEGDTDRYFFKSIFQEKYPGLDQKIAVLDIGGKGAFKEWTNLFHSFGLEVFRVADLDFLASEFYPGERGTGLKTQAAVTAFKTRNPDWETRIETEYAGRTFILKNGDLEHYLGVRKWLPDVIEFCNLKLSAYLADDANPESLEIRKIIQYLVA